MSTTALVADPDQLLTPAEAAEILRCSVDYVWKLCRGGKLRHLRKGRMILLRRRDLDLYIDGQATGGDD